MITIRPERPDQPEIAALLGTLDAYLRAAYNPDENHILSVQELLAPDIGFYVARRDADGRAVGTGAVRRMDGYGEIKRMYVIPDQRGQRIAEQLLQTLEDTLRADGFREARLETGYKQAEALRLYQRCGYTPCAPFAGYPDNGVSVFLGKGLS